MATSRTWEKFIKGAYMSYNPSAQYTRINKIQARKIYNAGGSIVILPCHANPRSIWFSGSDFSKENSGNRTFENLVNDYTYYNCNDTILGKRPGFWILSNENN